MAAQYYVTTSVEGFERTPAGEIAWRLPEEGSDGPAEITRGERLVLRQLPQLLDVLEEVVFLAEPVEEGREEAPGELAVSSARLLSRTAWDPLRAANFALDCAARVVGDAGDVELIKGLTLAGAIADARRYLAEANSEKEGSLGRLARYSAARRLRKEGGRIGDLALEMLEQDLTEELDATADPAWAMTTATGDAVLAAVETLRHLAAPHYVGTRELNAERPETEGPAVDLMPISTPFGPLMVGAEHESPYLSSGALAREAAFRAREVVGEHEAEERTWQAARLAEALAD